MPIVYIRTTHCAKACHLAKSIFLEEVLISQCSDFSKVLSNHGETNVEEGNREGSFMDSTLFCNVNV